MNTPENITNLKENEIFVFGSNLNGNHLGGAAKFAQDNFGAESGIGEGLTGQSYAFPTLDKEMQKVSLEALIESKKTLYKCAEENKDKQFLVTKVGCGIAGFSEEIMKEIFKDKKPNNIILPLGWGDKQIIRGYKAFEKGLVCRGFQYEFGKDFYHEGKIQICNSGFHFCKNLSDVYSYYSFTEEVIVCEVESEGEVIDEEQGNKSVTNHIRLIRMLNAEEKANNNGSGNVGHSNTGDRNTGDSNTGDRNTGHWNTGDRNTGHSNTGHSNTGHWNTGHWNTGDRNTGHSNTGHSNTGHWNTTNFNTGSFNTKEIKEVLVFNKLCKKKVWDLAPKPYCLYFETKKWIEYSDMTEEEKQQNESAKKAGGYIKTIDYKEAFTNSLKNASAEDIKLIKNLPNFNADVFEEISGFRIN